MENAEVNNESVAIENKIFVGGLSMHTTSETLQLHFANFGDIIHGVVMRDPILNRSRGFGFVTFKRAESLDNVQLACPHVLDGKMVDTKQAYPRRVYNSTQFPSNITNRLFLGGLKDCHDEDTLREYFSQFGNVSSVKVLVNRETARKRGFGFVEYQDTEGAAQALAQKQHLIKMIRVDVKKTTQFGNSGKRSQLMVGGAAQAGYAPPLPTINEQYAYRIRSINEQYAALPPSAYTNGWASYVVPPPLPDNQMNCNYQRPQQQRPHYTPQVALSPTFGHPPYVRPVNAYRTTPSPSPYTVRSATTSTPMATSLPTVRPRNEYKSVQAEAAAQQQEQANDLAQKSPHPINEYKLFQPNYVSPQAKPAKDSSPPAYGI